MATKSKKTTTTVKKSRTVTAPKRTTKATAPRQDQFTSVMIPIFAVLSVIFLLAVIQNYV